MRYLYRDHTLFFDLHSQPGMRACVFSDKKEEDEWEGSTEYSVHSKRGKKWNSSGCEGLEEVEGVR